MVKGGSVYSAQRTKPGTLLGGRKEQSQASYDDKTVDMLLDILLDMDEEDLNQLMQCDDSTTSGLLKSLKDMRGIDEDSIKQIKRLHDEGGNKKLEKSRAKGKNATDAMFSSAAANNYYQAIAYKIGAGSVASNCNDDASSSKNISWKGLKEDASVKNYYKAIAHKKVAINDNGSTDDASVGMSTLKSGDSLTSLQKTVAAAMKAGNTPAEVAKHLMKADSEKVDKRRTEKLVAEALKKNMTPTEIANFLMQAEETRQKEEEAKEAQRNIEKLVKEALKKGHTPSEVAEYLSRFGQETKEKNMNEQLVKDALKHGGKTPAEIAAFLLKADEEKRAQDLINEALKVCKSPKEIAEYLVKAEEDQRKAAAPPPPPVKALSCHRKHDALSTTSSVSHLRSISSMASELSSECSIVTEIVNKGETKHQVGTSVEASKKAGMKSTSSSLRGTKASSLQNKKAPKEKSTKQGISKKIGKDKKNKKAIKEKKETNGTPDELIDSVQLYAKVMIPEKAKNEGSVKKSEPVDVDSFMDESAEVSAGASGDSNEEGDSKMELVSVSSDGDNQEIALAATFNTGWGVVQEEYEPHEEIDVSLHDYKKVASAKKSSPKMQSMISKAKSGFLGMRVKRPDAAEKVEAASEKKMVKKGDLPPKIQSRAVPPVCTESRHSASEESSQLWDNIIDEDESKGDKNRGSKSDENDQKVKKSGATTKQVKNDDPEVSASNSVAKVGKKESKFARIMTFKKKTSPRKVNVHQKTSSSSSEGTSAGTEAETQSSASGAKNEDKVSGTGKEDNAVDKDQDDSTSDLYLDGPVSSIDLMCSDGMSDDGVSLPSVLRDTKNHRIAIWKEPSLLNKMRSDTSHPSMQSDNVNSKNTAETDSVTFVDDDHTERGSCVNSIKTFNTEVKEYADEIALIARQFQDGLKSVYTGVVGCQSPGLQERELNGEFSEETNQLAENQLAEMMQTKVMMKGEDKQKEAVATVMEEAALSGDNACDNRADDMKRKREMYLSKLKKVSLNHI